jgi:hypothetical protein
LFEHSERQKELSSLTESQVSCRCELVAERNGTTEDRRSLITTKKQHSKQATTQCRKKSQGRKKQIQVWKTFPEQYYIKQEVMVNDAEGDTRTREGSRRRIGTRRTREENLLHSKNLGIATFMILEKQENHLPRLKEKVKKEFHAYLTQLLLKEERLKLELKIVRSY